MRRHRFLFSLLVLALAVGIPLGASADPKEKYNLPPHCYLDGNPWDNPIPCPNPINSLPKYRHDLATFDVKVTLEVNNEDDTSTLKIKGDGFPHATPVTCWIVQPIMSTHPIFTEGYATLDAPCAPTYAAYASGRDPFNEPNVIPINHNGKADFTVNLDFNLLKASQVPLTNGMRITQGGIPDVIGDADLGEIEIHGLNQVTFRDSGVTQGIGREFLRVFNSDGEQVLDSNNRPVIARSPEVPAMLAIVSHLDGQTHGIAPDIFSLDNDANKQDHSLIFVTRFEFREEF